MTTVRMNYRKYYYCIYYCYIFLILTTTVGRGFFWSWKFLMSDFFVLYVGLQERMICFFLHFSLRELTHSFSTLASQVDSAKAKVKDKLAESNEEINRLEEIETKAKIYR